MVEDMARPAKRRKVAASEPVPTLTHSVEDLHRIERVEEVHMQIQHLPWHKRQASAVVSTLTSVNAAGSSVIETITIGHDTSTATSVLPTLSSSSVSFNSTSALSTGPSSGLTTTSNSTDISSKTTDHTSSHKTTAKTTAHSSPTSLGSFIYLATLTNGHIETVTRLDTPYVTTFPDGQVSTICDRAGQCQLTTDAHPTNPSSLTTYSYGSTSMAPVPPAAAGTTVQGMPSLSTSSSPTSSPHHHSGNTSPPPPGTIAGGVVGGAAGLAVILLAAMVFLRWYRRRTQLGHHVLPPSSGASPTDTHPGSSAMIERAGLRPLVGAVPAFFRHQNQSSEGSPPSERSFTKVSGRKLPSAFSEGMSSKPQPPNMPLTSASPEPPNYTGHSFYRDSNGFYGGDGAQNETLAETQNRAITPDGGHMTLSPGPQRTPTVHVGGPYVLSPTSSSPGSPVYHNPTSPFLGSSSTAYAHTIARSETPSSVPDNRSSRFLEEV